MYVLKATIATTFIRFLPSFAQNQSAQSGPDFKKAAFADQFADNPDDPKRKIFAQNMMTNFNLIERLKFSNFFKSFLERCRQPKRNRLLEEA